MDMTQRTHHVSVTRDEAPDLIHGMSATRHPMAEPACCKDVEAQRRTALVPCGLVSLELEPSPLLLEQPGMRVPVG